MRLREFSGKASRTQTLIKNYRFDRRSQTRFKVSGKCRIQIVKASGEPLGSFFYGELSDVSVGGASFLVTIKKKETARLLLGRRVNLVFDLPVDLTDRAIERDGIIVAVREYTFDECSIHIKFNELLAEKLLEGLR
jgi:hypothetical protein